MADFRLETMLQNQQMGLDPFAQARQQQSAKMVGVADQQLISGDAMNPLAPMPVPQTSPAMPQAKSLIQAPSGGQMSGFESSGLPKILQKMGVDDKGLALNDLGRVQLMGRLKSKFGDQFNQNPDALQALSAFDKSISEFSMDNRKKMNQTVATGQRTLKALLGGA